MGALPLADSELLRVMELIQEAIAAGCVPPGGHLGTGKTGTVAYIAKSLGMSHSGAQDRVKKALARFQQGAMSTPDLSPWTYPRTTNLELRNASVMVAGDLHMWPLARVPMSPIKEAFRKVAEEICPAAIVLNGDLIDGTRISRHPKLRGQSPPRVIEEVQAASDFMLSLPDCEYREITMSNHDVRVDDYLANQAPELEDLCMRMIDRMPGWRMSYSVVINNNTEIRHETGAGGIHARHNNATRTGWTTVTNHTHQLGVAPVYTRRGVHWGVECGQLSHDWEPMFEYTWGRPTRWQAGFVVLTYDDDGVLMPPETCEWLGDRAVFRGKIVEIKPRYRVRAA